MTKRSILLASLAAPALLLGGCMGTENRGIESVHQPIVRRSDYALDLTTARGGLVAGESRRLAGWMAAMRLGFGDTVTIDDPGYAAAAARDEIAAVVASYGLLLSDDAPVTAAPVAPGTVRVVVSRSRASVPGCPDWSRNSSNEFEGNMSSNYGCATNTNLAAMVARPEDLVHGHSGSGINDPASTTKAIDAFRKVAPSGGGGGTLQGAGGAGGK